MALTQEQIKSYRQQYGIGGSVLPEVKKPLSNRIANGLGFEKATDTFGSLLARQGVGSQTKEQGQEFVEKPTGKEITGAGLQVGATLVPGFAGAKLATQALAGGIAGYMYDVGSDLLDDKSVGETVAPGIGTAIGVLTPPILRTVGSVLGKTKTAVTSKATDLAENLKVPKSAEGVVQAGKDLVERVPRFVGRVKEDVAESALKAEKLKTATPAVREAVKVDLPEKYINTISQADDATKQAYKRVLDIADETPKTVGVKKNPTIVGGELASKQYDLIEKQRKLIGSKIGEQVEALGKSNVKANMGVAFNQIDDVLVQNGIGFGKGGKLAFAGKYTPAERARIQELYSLSREAGDTLTAKQVRDMDQLFSKLQRETRMEGIGDLRVNANGEEISMFRMFRDIYSNQLENIAPEIKQLNSQYRNLVTLLDDIEDSIIKTPNFNVTKSTDSAEFAKVNLRRIFGESQSSPAYEAIADEMDAISRKLGYTDAKPKDVASFAQEIRELYPESTPRTGFAGGIRTGIMDIAEKVLSAGKVDTTDQRKALRALLDEVADQK